MIRPITACLMRGVLLAAFALPSSAIGAQIRTSAVVDAPIVHLGDVIEGAGEAAGVRLTAAPEPGKRSAIATAEIIAAARRAGLEVDGMASGPSVTIVRAGRPVSAETVRAAIAEALIDAGADPDGATRVRIAERDLAIQVPRNAEATVRVDTVDYDAGSSRFRVRLSAPAEGADAVMHEITGRLVDMAVVPVPIAQIPAGTLVTEDLIDWVEVPARRVSARTLVDAGAILGLEARRPLAAGRPMMAGDVRRPVMVARGAMVTMRITMPGISLTALGRSMEAASLGDVVRLVNTASNKQVQGVVTGPNEVQIPTAGSFPIL